jgi:hypothetical protein
LTAAIVDLLAAVQAITVGNKALLREHAAHTPSIGEQLGETVQLLHDL